MKEQSLRKVTKFLKTLEDAKIYYTLDSNRDDTIMVSVSVPGEKWEIEFFTNGEVEIEKFISSGDIFDELELKELFANYAEGDAQKFAQDSQKEAWGIEGEKLN